MKYYPDARPCFPKWEVFSDFQIFPVFSTASTTSTAVNLFNFLPTFRFFIISSTAYTFFYHSNELRLEKTWFKCQNHWFSAISLTATSLSTGANFFQRLNDLGLGTKFSTFSNFLCLFNGFNHQPPLIFFIYFQVGNLLTYVKARGSLVRIIFHKKVKPCVGV